MYIMRFLYLLCSELLQYHSAIDMSYQYLESNPTSMCKIDWYQSTSNQILLVFIHYSIIGHRYHILKYPN